MSSGKRRTEQRAETKPAEPTGVRARARQARLDEILSVANRQLAELGAAGLSLRAIAREVGIVSSAIHRYFPTRDDLLTSLIIGAYDSLGRTAEQSVAASRTLTPGDRWVDAAGAVRTWGVQQPHRWALLYGTPVPGYAAPDRTVEPGIRVSLALLSIVEDARNDGMLRPAGESPFVDPVDLDPRHGLGRDLVDLTDQINLHLEPTILLRSLTAWSQLFGLISFELFGQTKGMVSHDEALFIATARTMAEVIGLPRAERRPRRHS